MSSPNPNTDTELHLEQDPATEDSGSLEEEEEEEEAEWEGEEEDGEWEEYEEEEEEEDDEEYEEEEGEEEVEEEGEEEQEQEEEGESETSEQLRPDPWPLHLLSDDVLLHILSFIHPGDLFRMGFINSRFRRVSSNDILWRRHVTVRNTAYYKVIKRSLLTRKRAIDSEKTFIEEIRKRYGDDLAQKARQKRESPYFRAKNREFANWENFAESFEKIGLPFENGGRLGDLADGEWRETWAKRHWAIGQFLERIIDDQEDENTPPGESGWNCVIVICAPCLSMCCLLIAVSLAVAFGVLDDSPAKTILAGIGLGLAILSILSCAVASFGTVVVNDCFGLAFHENNLVEVHDVLNALPMKILQTLASDWATLGRAKKMLDGTDPLVARLTNVRPEARQRWAERELRLGSYYHTDVLSWKARNLVTRGSAKGPVQMTPLLCGVFAFVMLIPVIVAGGLLSHFVGTYAVILPWCLGLVILVLCGLYVCHLSVKNTIHQIMDEAVWTRPFFVIFGCGLAFWVPSLVAITVGLVIDRSTTSGKTVGIVFGSIFCVVALLVAVTFFVLLIFYIVQRAREKNSRVITLLERMISCCGNEGEGQALHMAFVTVLSGLVVLFIGSILAALVLFGVYAWVSVVVVLLLVCCLATAMCCVSCGAIGCFRCLRHSEFISDLCCSCCEQEE